MQTETPSGPFPVQDLPAHLLEVPEVASDSTACEAPLALTPRPEVLPESLGAFRGAIFCLPIAVMMWAVIIVAVLHFLIA